MDIDGCECVGKGKKTRDRFGRFNGCDGPAVYIIRDFTDRIMGYACSSHAHEFPATALLPIRKRLKEAA